MELLKKNAVEIVSLLKSGEITPLDCLNTLQKRISKIDGKVNALPILCFERAYENARKLQKLPLDKRGVLSGLPIPIKDITDVSGVRCTSGSNIFKNFVPKKSDEIVKRIESNGGIVFAKSNTAELATGGNTFNELFGATLNPWNTKLSSAGSSGGAAVSVATGMSWVAHGTDNAGSIRSPSSFCGTVGLRPSIGRVSSSLYNKVDSNFTVNGPIARNVADAGLLLDAMIGESYNNPLSLKKEPHTFLSQSLSPKKPIKIAFSLDLGITPVSSDVKTVLFDFIRKLEYEGIIVEENHPNLQNASTCYQTLRALDFYISMKDLYEDHKKHLKPEVIWNLEKGMNLKAEEIAIAEGYRLEIVNNMQKFFQEYDLLICPSTISTPYPVGERYLKECNGQKFDTYIDWLMIASAITLSCSPAISIPGGFTKDTLPVGIQIISSIRNEADLLSKSAFIEKVINLKNYFPVSPN